mmetsp:Transcript_5390/g.19006  ORF Transcript_5390/g.19006 Transcript_5390/m.19006 type:complete len:94 (+) Transcript_5390:181-462(+)
MQDSISTESRLLLADIHRSQQPANILSTEKPSNSDGESRSDRVKACSRAYLNTLLFMDPIEQRSKHIVELLEKRTAALRKKRQDEGGLEQNDG